MDISQVLIQFVFRLSFGLSLAMSITSPRVVNAGFYRVHLWVLMGVNTLGAMAIYTRRGEMSNWGLLLTLAILMAVVSYVGSVIWIYENARFGMAVLFAVCATALLAGIALHWPDLTTFSGQGMAVADVATSGLLMGATLGAMLLGHWYLNSPSMNLSALRRLMVLLLVALALRTVVSGAGLGLEVGVADSPNTSWWLFVSLRWLAGLLLPLPLALLTWQTLKIPNTQSATGILYAALILAFIGELTSQLLSAETTFPI